MRMLCSTTVYCSSRHSSLQFGTAISFVLAKSEQEEAICRTQLSAWSLTLALTVVRQKYSALLIYCHCTSFWYKLETHFHQFHSQIIPPNIYQFHFVINQYFFLNCCSFKCKMKFSYSSKLWKPLHWVMHYRECFCRNAFGFILI